MRGTVKVWVETGDTVQYHYDHCLRPGRYTRITKEATFIRMVNHRKPRPEGESLAVIQVKGNRGLSKVPEKNIDIELRLDRMEEE